MKRLDIDDISVVILAGGKGRRMGGKDKGLIPYKDTSLISHVIAAIRKQTNNIIINANRNLDEYAAFGYAVVEDTLTDYQGPLAGFIAAMSSVNTDYILTLPCDGPVIDDHYLQKMMQAMNETSCEIAIASDGTRMQPVYALLPVSLKESLGKFLANGGRKIDQWYSQHDFTQVEFNPETGFFTNINSNEDLIKYS